MDITDDELRTVISVGTKRNAELAKELLNTREKIDKATEILMDLQGEWVSVDEVFAPNWCGPIKEAVRMLEGN